MGTSKSCNEYVKHSARKDTGRTNGPCTVNKSDKIQLPTP